MRIFATLLAASTLALSTGCATILKGKYESITVASEPPGAMVTVNGVTLGRTPTAARVDGTRDQIVMIAKEGHEPINIILTSSVGVGWVIVGLWGGLLIDAITGDWRSLDQNNVSVVLEKK
jgi:hypothetical protein